MGLWKPLNRPMLAFAIMSVFAARYTVAAWGQGAGEPFKSPASATVSVATLRVPLAAWKHFDRASSAVQRHRTEEFERESAKALEIAPEFAQVYLLRATVDVNANRFEAGIANVQTALRFDPGTMWADVVLAGAYNGMHRFHDALLVLNAQRGREAESWQAMYERARAEIGERDTPAALHWSALMLEAAPREFTDARLVRANALFLAKRWAESTDQLTAYLDSKGPQPHRAQARAMRDEAVLRAAAPPQMAIVQNRQIDEAAIR